MVVVTLHSSHARRRDYWELAAHQFGISLLHGLDHITGTSSRGRSYRGGRVHLQEVHRAQAATGTSLFRVQQMYPQNGPSLS